MKRTYELCVRMTYTCAVLVEVDADNAPDAERLAMDSAEWDWSHSELVKCTAHTLRCRPVGQP